MLTVILRQILRHGKTLLWDLFPDPLLARNSVLLGRHRGQRCFILGSGHSIMSQDLTRLHGHIVMTQNHFHAHQDIQIIHPTYHVVVPKYQPREFDADWRTWLCSMNDRLPPETTLFFGANTQYLVEDLALFRDRVFFIRDGYQCPLIRRAPVKLTRSIMSVQTVLLECLAIAIYMGFQEIVLLGFDLDQPFRQHDRNNVRFYGHSPITANKAEVAIEEMAGASGIDWLAMWVIWRQCNLLKSEAHRRGCKIINATRGGLLNMFERARYEDLILRESEAPGNSPGEHESGPGSIPGT